MNPEDFSEWLGETLEEKGLNHMYLAAMTGMTPQAIRYYLLAERSPTLASLETILKALGKKILFVDA